MEVKLALIADAANVTGNGKLNILGQFTNIHVRSGFPMIWPSCVLVIRIEGSPESAAKDHTFRIDGVDEDGNKFLGIDGRFTFEAPPNLAIPPSTGTTINLVNIPYEKAGVYEYNIFINDRYMDSVPILVIDANSSTS